MHWLVRSSSFSKAQGLRETDPRALIIMSTSGYDAPNSNVQTIASVHSYLSRAQLPLTCTVTSHVHSYLSRAQLPHLLLDQFRELRWLQGTVPHYSADGAVKGIVVVSFSDR